MKRAIAILSALSMLIPACSSKGDILARMEGHIITRGEFYHWLENRGLPVTEIMKNREAAVMNLEQLAAEKLTAEKAVNSGFAKDPYYRKLHDIVYRNYAVSFYRGKLEENLKFTSTAADIGIISIDYKGNRNSKSFRDALLLMKNKVLPELKKGISFEEAARRFSQDESASEGGGIGFIIPSMYGDDFAAEVLKLGADEFTPEPVVIGNSVLLIKVKRYADINEKNIKKIISDEHNLERIKNYMLESALRENEKKSISEHNVVSRIDSVSWSKPGDIIFTIDGDNFTVRDLDEILEIFSGLKYGSRPFYRATAEEKVTAVRRLLREMLLFKEAAAKGIESDPDFKIRWELVKRSVISGAYKYIRFSNEFSVTRKDILNEYKRLKALNPRQRGEVPGLSVLSPEVENRIREELFKAAVLSFKKEWDSKVLRDSGFIINDKGLNL
jgi:peptidyl-prolyl cis-trans isomerase C